MRLALCTWPEVEEYLDRSTGAIVPIGSTEQHGPTGMIGTDALAADAVAIGAGEQAGAPVAPPIAVGMAHHHMAFPGTLSLRPSTLMAVIADVVGSLAAHGVQRVLFINGHGGNAATVSAAFAEIHSLRRSAGKPGLRLAMTNWYDGPTVRRLRSDLYGNREGSHATPSEIALVQALHPDRTVSATLEPALAPAGGFHDAADLRRRYADGRIGSDPSLARAEDGARLLDAAVRDAANAYRRLVDGD